MTTQTTFICNGCGKQKRGVPHGEQEHDIQEGSDGIAEDWSDLRLQNFGKPLRVYFRHYCPGCTKRMIAIINGPLDE